MSGRRIFALLGVIGWAVLLAGPSPTAASTPPEIEPAPEAAPKGRLWTVGLGVAAVPDYEGSEDYKAAPVPLVKVVDPRGWYVELLGTTLRANVLPSHTWRLGPLVRYRAERSDVENSAVDRMEDVDAAFEAGGFVGLSIANWQFRLEAAADVADGHDGALATLTAGYTWPLKTLRMTLSGFATYASDDYMSTYFGVQAEDSARSGIATYEADAGIKDAGATLAVTYQFRPRWGLTGAFRYARLLGDAADSPLVENRGSEHQMVAAALVSYTF